MLRSLVGLIACASLYLISIYGFVWMGKRRIERASRRGVALSPEPMFPSAAEIWRRHSVDMTVIYGLFFGALGLADFTIWQRVGIAGLAALVFGSVWISNSSYRLNLGIASPARERAGAIGYWCLSIADWFGYLGILCFGTALIVEVI